MLYHQDLFECWAVSWQSSYRCIVDGFWNPFSCVHIWIWYWSSHSCIGKSCDGWEMGLCYLSSDCTGLEEMVKVYIWQWLSWFKIRFWYLRQCVSVIFLGCCLCDWNGLGEHWTPRTCMRYPYQVSSYCKCVASPKSCSGVCTLMVENSVLADSVSYLNRTSMFEWCVSDQLRPILPYVVSMSIS